MNITFSFRSFAAFVLISVLISSEISAQPAESSNRRCPQNVEIGTGGFPFGECPWMTEATQNQASVSDQTFTTYIEFGYLGGADLLERWTGPNYFVERVYEWVDPYFVGPCAVGFGSCQYFDGSWLEREFWSLSRGELEADNVGTWLYEEVANGVVLRSKTFEVNELQLTALQGSNQFGLVGEELPNPLQVQLTAFDGDPIKDEVIGWEWVSIPGGAKDHLIWGIGSGSETDDQGIDEAFVLLGSKPGVYTLRLNNRRMLSEPEFTFTAIDDIEDTDPELDHPLVEEGVGQTEQCDAVGNPIGVSLGNKFQKEVDIESNGISPIEFVRYHNSLGYVSTSFENYWTHTYDRRIEIPLNPQLDPVKVIRPDGKKINFNWDGGSYQPSPGVESTLEQTAAGWQYVDDDSVIENFDQDGLLLEIIDLNGMVQTATHDNNDQLIRIESSIGTSLDFAYDGNGRVGTVTDQTNRTWTYDYDILGRLQVVFRPDGTVREYHYEDLRHAYALTGISYGSGARYSHYEYDEQGRAIASYLANDVNRVDIQYDPNGDRVVLDPLGNATVYETRIENKRGVLDAISGPICSQGCGVTDTEYTYDSEYNVTSKIQYGVTTSYGDYDVKGQPGYIIEAVGTLEEKRTDYEYDPRFFNKVTKKTEPSVFPGQFKVTDRTYDAMGNLTSETISGFDPSGQPVSRTRSYTYNAPYGQISSSDGPRTGVSDVTTFEYYPDDQSAGPNRARLKSVIDPNGMRIRENIQYTSTGKIDSEFRPNGIVIDYEYDSDNDRVISLTESGGGSFNRTTWEYTSLGEVRRIIQDDESGEEFITQFFYDSARRLDRVESRVTRKLSGQYYIYFDDAWVEYAYDDAGNVSQERSGTADIPGQQWVIDRVFDAYSRIDKIIRGGITEDFDYNPDGTLASKTDGNLNTTTYMYDAFKRLISTEDVGQVITTNAYDAQSNKVSVTDPENNSTLYEYDDLGNLVKRTSPDTGITTYLHDSAGQVINETDAKGQLTVYTYDAGGRVTSIDRDGSDYDLTYTYDVCPNGEGRLCSISTGWGHNIQYEWNALGQISSATSNEGQVGYTYGPNGVVTSIEYPSGRIVHFDLDGGGYPDEIGLEIPGFPTAALVENIKYSPLGRPVSWEFVNGLVTTVDLDARHRPESIDVPGVWSWQATNYDANDNILDLSTSADSYSFAYDTQNRLIDADTASIDIDYQYDKVGNRLSRTVDTVVESGTYEPQSNRIDAYGDRDLTLDANGNTITQEINLAPDKTFVYSAHNRLVEVIDDQTSTTIATYQYDALGQRVTKTTATETRKFIYGQNGELLAVLDGNDNVLHEYVYLSGSAIIDLSEVPEGLPPSLPPEVLVDNDAATVGGSNWQTKSSPLAQNGTYEQNRKLPDRWVTWFIDDDVNFQGGIYEVFVKWFAQDGTQTTYDLHVRDGSGGSVSYFIDVPHAGLSVGDWVSLGTFEFQDRSPYGRFQNLQLQGEYNNSGLLGTFLLADAVKAVPLVSPIDLVDLKFIHYDHLGTPHAVTDESGTVIWTASYLPFGEATVNQDPDGDLEDYELSLRFPGQYADPETGLHYNYFRDYDPAIGRYLEGDPIGLLGGLNVYGYSTQNPIVHTDPRGLNPVLIFNVICEALDYLTDEERSSWEQSVRATFEHNDKLIKEAFESALRNCYAISDCKDRIECIEAAGEERARREKENYEFLIRGLNNNPFGNWNWDSCVTVRRWPRP